MYIKLFKMKTIINLSFSEEIYPNNRNYLLYFEQFLKLNYPWIRLLTTALTRDHSRPLAVSVMYCLQAIVVGTFIAAMSALKYL